jgi:hypothetical protein
VRTKKQLRIGANVRVYYTSDSTQNKATIKCRDMMDRGHHKNIWRSDKNNGGCHHQRNGLITSSTHWKEFQKTGM